MIYNIIKLSNISVKEVIVPRIDVTSIDSTSKLPDILNIVCDKGHSRLPVFANNIDNIIGILHVKDLLKCMANKENFNVSDIIRPPLFVPESKMINDLMVEMREKNTHLAIVVDEYGGMSGIVCLEDIIEKIVGEIHDEFDHEMEIIEKLDDKTFLINARITLEELNEQIGTDIHEEEIDTLGGLIYMILGRIPLKNEKITYLNYLFTIESISGRQLKKIKLEIQNTMNHKKH